MSKRFVAGFVKRDDTWVRTWIMLEQHSGHRRAKLLEEARSELASQLGIYCGGEAVARRNMIVIDGIAPDGREFIDQIFALLREG